MMRRRWLNSSACLWEQCEASFLKCGVLFYIMLDGDKLKHYLKKTFTVLIFFAFSGGGRWYGRRCPLGGGAATAGAS